MFEQAQSNKICGFVLNGKTTLNRGVTTTP